MRQASFPRMFQVVEAEVDRVNNVYEFHEFFEREQGLATVPSLWEMRMGIKYKF